MPKRKRSNNRDDWRVVNAKTIHTLEREVMQRAPWVRVQISYSRYIHSKEWYALRKKILRRDEGRCLMPDCQREASNVHHIHYDTLGMEDGSELVSLCGQCHREEHRSHPRISMRRPFWSELLRKAHGDPTRIGYARHAHEELDAEYKAILQA